MAKRSKKTGGVARDLALAGELCLAFANTAASRQDARYRRSPSPARPALADYGDLVAWGLEMGVLETHDAQRLKRTAAERNDQAAAVFARAMELRRALGRIFTAVAAGKPTAATDLATLNAALAELVPARQVATGPTGFRWTRGGDDAALARVLWPVAESAAELLISDDRRRVRQCADPPCPLLFVDRRSGLRQWCDPNTCGSRAKGRRNYRRGGKAGR